MGPQKASEKQKKLCATQQLLYDKKANKKQDLNKDARLKILKEFKSSYVYYVYFTFWIDMYSGRLDY
jgi:hypothetical protein